jgi:hypothetical protein
MDHLKGEALSPLIEAITELVIKELEAARAGGRKSVLASSAGSGQTQGPRLLVVAGPEPVADAAWVALASAKVRASALVWSSFRQDQLPAPASGWTVEVRAAGWTKVVGDYSALCLLGADLPTLGSIASLGAGGMPPSGAAVAALAAGLPVFVESTVYENVRRHSARLAPGFVRAFEQSWRAAESFGVEMGGVPELTRFLHRLAGSKEPGAANPAAPAAKTGSRDVVTTEDVETAHRAGHKQLLVAMGAIVTPLASQRASEWGIEVKFQ